MNSKIGIIVAREFNERVRKKSFIITTILAPIFMVAVMVLPVVFMMFSSTDAKVVAVVDESGIVAPKLESNEELTYIVDSDPLAEVRKRDDVFGVLYINKDVVKNPNGVKFYTNDALPVFVEASITHTVKSVVRDQRLQSYNIENLDKILADADVDLTLQTFKNKIDADSEEEESASAMTSYMLGLFLSMALYMLMLLYGQLAMNSIVEEKGNRVLEVMVGSVKPFQLMFGKILGVGAVAVVQLLIWSVLVTLISGVLMPLLVPSDMMAEVTAMQSGTLDTTNAHFDMDLIQTISVISNVWYIVRIFGYMLLYLIGGYFFYSAIYAAVGSAVENIQDAAQLSNIATLPIIFGIIFEMSCIQDPNGSLAFWGSMIPFISPMVMIVRLPFDVPDWQVWVSLAILYASCIGMVWLAAKIYRVGIFMYGKKPSLKELAKWATYK
ncbi:MAG: ABC transporter permease [Muribaculaceae bacterium]|nr:ABC transporter permease [Muribaculaceae bacterium]